MLRLELSDGDSVGAVEVCDIQRELWRRMAFNALCGNGDDHPRNHGLLYRDGRWGLADAFDIAPCITFSGTLAMAMTREGDSAATPVNLLKNCDNFGYEKAEALYYLAQSKQKIASGWGHELTQCGHPSDLLPTPSFV
jgi:serine/threonine-protein kinase HipA